MRCDLPPFHALAARRTLAGWVRHTTAVSSNAAKRASGIARQTPQMSRSHPGMAAVRLRVSFRAVITESRPPDLSTAASSQHRAPLRSTAGAVGPASVKQPGDRLPRDQSPGDTEVRARGLLWRGYCRGHWRLRLHACRSDQSQLLGAAYCFAPAGGSELAEDALEVSFHSVNGEVHRGGDFFGAEH